LKTTGRDPAGDGVDLPEGWTTATVEEVLRPHGIFDGPFGSSLKTQDYADFGVRVIRLENIGHLEFVSTKETFISDDKYRSLVKHTVGEGDIIFASFVSNEIRACVLPKLPTIAIAKADCFCLRPDETIVDPHFLAFQLASQRTYDTLVGDIHGATRPRVNTAQLRRLSISVPPRAEQTRIVSRVTAILLRLNDAHKRFERVATLFGYDLAVKRASPLLQAVLRKSLDGALVETEAELARLEDRDYEPASVLLERTRAERTAAAQSQPKNGKRRSARRKVRK
jgi:type I restriction enzyme S subunit